MNAFESFLAHLGSLLIPVGEALVSGNNPGLAPVVNMIGNSIASELASIASGNAPTTTAAVEAIAPGGLALASTLIAKNNPKDTQAIADVVGAIVSAIPAPAVSSSAPTPAAPPSTPSAA